MAKSDGTVYVDTRIDTKGFGKGVNTMQKQIGGLSGAIGKLGIAIAATFAVKKLVQFGKEAIDLGSDLQEVQNVVDVTFSTMSEKVNEFAQGAAEAAGLSETMAKRYMGTFGAMSKAFGFVESEAYAMSESLTLMVGDVASFYNLTQDEAYTKLKSVFTGETESLKDLGVVMTQSALDAYAMANGYGKTTKAMTEQEKVALRYAFVLDQLSAASGDFQRTSDSWANQTRILALSIETLKANIGQALINIFTPLLKIINQVVSKMAQLSKYFVAFSELIVGKSTSGGGGSPGEALGDIESGYEGIADATEEATKAQKKYVTGLDEIRTFAEKNDGLDDLGLGGIGGIDNYEETKEEVEDVNDLIEELEAKYPKLIKFAKDSTQKLKEIFNDFAVGDFFEAGKDISELVTGIYDFITQAIEDVDWRSIGNKIGDFLAGIKWIDVIKKAFKLKVSIWEAIADVWFGMFDAAPIETAVLSSLALLKFTGAGNILANKIFGSFGIALATAFAGYNIGKELGKLIFPDDAQLYDDFSIGNFFDEMFNTDFETHKQAIVDMSKDFGGLIGNLDTLKEKIEESGFSFDDFFAKFKGKINEVKPLVKDWFNNHIKPWFTKEKWVEAMEGVKDAFDATWKGAVNVAISLINKFIDYLNDKMHFEWDEFKDPIFGQTLFGAGSIQLFTIPKIPMLATGAVIPPNAPFMAMLGDQKHGTNIEAPLDTIKQAVREVVGNNGGGQYAFTAQINRRTLFEEMIDEAKLRQSTSGRNPFDLA